MPVLIFIVPVISVVLISSSDWFWSLNVADRISIFTSCITAAAFCATAWNAYEAKKSAKAAMKAVQITSDSLTEARKSSRNTVFENPDIVKTCTVRDLKKDFVNCDEKGEGQ